MRTRKLSRLTQTAIGPKTVEFENIVQQAQIKKHLKTNGKFLQFQYSLISKKDIHGLFNVKPNIDFELL